VALADARAALLLIPTLLWRRSHPLAVVTLGFGSMLTLSVAQLVADPGESPGLHTMAILLLALYALFRWGSGLEILFGTAVVMATGTVAVIADFTDVGEAIGGYTVLGIIVMLDGAAVRFRAGPAGASSSRCARPSASTSHAICTTPSRTTCPRSRSAPRPGSPSAPLGPTRRSRRCA
jgi:hypothetical protein